ncbi:23S rRNA (uracil(1939)-C(5))-methyltransferase RlmD [Sporolactobacillus shoreicorticis]|uniref:23S rRNA (Uracil(1939)-C(5))-methyltransferase RlmD n=1 Tax=Sporolactobacillus shoreicorticis TaxID=1923877 RepID=A0ABW5S0I3_9BACL|nr:23S rRNA (uracil(1939)-C(5))-methyltransferase RlmD [Sporolactobacillus shoreicorticis]MCO7124595.1 23S rRNA (uracil(1939)-C(5))-methyltransferase RlmD [Sporolactobacillus shoreicorticis]
MSESNIPVAKNEQLEVSFSDLTQDGSAVAKVDGYTLFIPGGLPGEKAIIQVIKTKKGYGYGRLIELTKTSDRRAEPPCPYYDQCGGCAIQHISSEGQLAYKREIVQNALERIGGLTDIYVESTLGMAKPWRYRNKIQVPVAQQNGKFAFGFYKKRSHDIVTMDHCMITEAIIDDIVQTARQIAEEHHVMPYDETKHRGVLRHIMARVGKKTGEVMVVFVTRTEELPHRKTLIRELIERYPHIKSIAQNINTKRTNAIFGDTTKTLWGRDVIYDQIGGVTFAISARSFFQVNPTQTEVLYGKALEYAELTGQETVIDAYCGIGTISLFLAKQAKHVYGVEIVPEAIEDARKNAELNKITNATFKVGKSEDVIPVWRDQGINPDVIVVDPPRKGCDASLIDTMTAMQPQRIVYVSCNPATLARDLKLLTAGGYQVKKVQPVDMFPQTMHVECAVLMTRVDK